MENQKLRNISIALLFSFKDYELVEKNARNLFKNTKYGSKLFCENGRKHKYDRKHSVYFE